MVNKLKTEEFIILAPVLVITRKIWRKTQDFQFRLQWLSNDQVAKLYFCIVCSKEYIVYITASLFKFPGSTII